MDRDGRKGVVLIVSAMVLLTIALASTTFGMFAPFPSYGSSKQLFTNSTYQTFAISVLGVLPYNANPSQKTLYWMLYYHLPMIVRINGH